MRNPSPLRYVAPTLLLFAVAASSGCSWLRGPTGYEGSPESRPLEVPPDLDRPTTVSTMQIPSTPAAPGAAGSTIASSAAFSIADSGDSAWRRLGIALERIDGANIVERAQLLNAYNVSFEGETFLVRVNAEGEGSRIAALGPDGRESMTPAAGRLLGLLRSRLN